MLRKRKNGFTLVELLVVISILGILAAALSTQVSKVRETAQAMKCKANLRNLAQAALTYAGDGHSGGGGRWMPENVMPWAGSYERGWPTMQNGKYVVLYHECPGWVEWYGSFDWPSREPRSSSMKRACYFGDSAYYSISNGVLWTYVGKDISAYGCETHLKIAKRKGLEKAVRSYVMNSYFGFSNRTAPVANNMPDWRTIGLDSVSAEGNAGNLLLFAEIPAFHGSTHTESVPTDEYGQGSDGVLETKVSGYTANSRSYTPKEEIIGFNHRVSKRHVAHVAFADGHVDVLVEPKGTQDTDLKELTRQLCNGDEVEQALREKMR